MHRWQEELEKPAELGQRDVGGRPLRQSAPGRGLGRLRGRSSGKPRVEHGIYSVPAESVEGAPQRVNSSPHLICATRVAAPELAALFPKSEELCLIKVTKW